MSHVLSNNFAVKIAEAIGVPIKNCTGMIISMEVGEPVRVRASYLVEDVAADKIFELVDKLEAVDANDSE